MISALVVLAGGFPAWGQGVSERPFRVEVVDRETGRGVPLAALRSVNDVVWWTDSAGVAAIDEPGWFGGEVFLKVSSPGYEMEADGFGFRGIRVRMEAGGTHRVAIRRMQIAERLYRVTGGGIYRDTILTGGTPPLEQPLLNGRVVGQDTVVTAVHRGRLFWFWGDTDRPEYPLGHFGAAGAVSRLPGGGGLDPATGVDLDYFRDASGFSRPVCPEPSHGLRWIESVFGLRDPEGRDRLVARVAHHRDLGPALAWYLMVWNEESERFDIRKRWEWDEGHDSAHPFRRTLSGREWIFLYPGYRVEADWDAVGDLGRYEAWTCVSGDGRVGAGDETAIERDAAGRVIYAWKAGADRLHAGRLRRLVQNGLLRPEEAWTRLVDVLTGDDVPVGRGSVFWNGHRGRWVRIVSGAPGDIWFAEADTPTGPWGYSARVATHDGYNFYNPTQHPEFDEAGGRRIFFEGTYTQTFSAAPEITPRYDYNQIMYRLDLEEPRLDLPVAVYRWRDVDGRPLWGVGAAARASGVLGADATQIAFFALEPGRRRDGTHRIAGEAVAGDGFIVLPPAPGDGIGDGAGYSVGGVAVDVPGSVVEPLPEELGGAAAGRVWSAPVRARTWQRW